MEKPRVKASRILSECKRNCKFWDCYNDCELEEDHAKDMALFVARTAQKGARDEQYWDNVISYINAT